MDFSKFGKKTPRRIHIIKNHSFWISYHRYIKEQNLEKEINREEIENYKIS